MINPITVSWAFVLCVLILSLARPRWARPFFGFFFIAMGLGVNLSLVIAAPHLFVEIGKNSLLPIYQPLFREVVAAAPAAWGLFIALFEMTMGVMILSSGRWVRLGFIGVACFCTAIIPLSWESVPNVLLVASALYLAFTQQFDRPVIGRRPLKKVS